MPFPIATATSGESTKVPQVVSHLWLHLLELYPVLRSEYVQVLVFVVVPLALLLAVRCAWIMGVLALLVHLFASHRLNWIIETADFLACFELLRTFPRNLTLAPEGLRLERTLRFSVTALGTDFLLRQGAISIRSRIQAVRRCWAELRYQSDGLSRLGADHSTHLAKFESAPLNAEFSHFTKHSRPAASCSSPC